jgi:hypothetical protein
MSNEQQPDAEKPVEAEKHEAVEGAVPFEAEDPQNATAQPKPKEHTRTIGNNKFRCFPMVPGAKHDPAKGRPFTDDSGNEYWCVPYEDWYKYEFGPRYNSRGRIDPNIID